MRLSLKFRFVVAAVLVASAVLVDAFLTLQGQQTAALLTREALAKDVEAMRLAGQVKHDLILHDDLVFRFLSTGDGRLARERRRAKARTRISLAKLQSLSDSPTVKELLSQLRRETTLYFADAEELIKTAPHGLAPEQKVSIFSALGWVRQAQGQQRALGPVAANVYARLTLVYSLCDKLLDVGRIRMEDAQQRINDALDRSERTIRLGGYAVFGASLLVGLLLAVSVLLPLSELQAGIQRVMDGELDVVIPPRGADELGRITQAFNDMARRLREDQQQLVRETITDALTGLRNFRYFKEALGAETERARRYDRPLSVLLLDIDHFKAYNDTHGHEMGNVLLKSLAQVLTESLRPSDILARYGGEEFVALLPETDPEGSRSVAERVRQAVASCSFPGQETQPGGQLTVSLGGASFPGDAWVAADLVEKADRALYRAKANGRNRVEWT